MMHCKYCGKEIEEGEVCSCRKEVRVKKTPILLISIIGVLIIALVVCIVLLSQENNPSDNPSVNDSQNNTENNQSNDNNDNESQDNSNITGGSGNNESTEENTTIKTNPFNYVKAPCFSGYNGSGEINISVDRDALIVAIIGDEPDANDWEEYSEWLREYNAFDQAIDDITITYSKNYDLQNGDAVTVTMVMPELLADKVENASKTYMVSGLPEVEVFDFFSNIDVEYEGVSGNAKANIVIKDNSDVMSACVFEISPQYSLSENDTITISITNAEILKDDYSVVPLELSKTYTVPKLVSYAVSVSQLPISVIQELAELYYADRLETLQSDNDIEYKNIEYSGTTFYVSNGIDSSLNAPYENILEISVSYEIYLWGTSHGIRCDSLYFTNILVESDGTVSLDYDDHAKYMKSFNEDYYVVKPITLESLNP